MKSYLAVQVLLFGQTLKRHRFPLRMEGETRGRKKRKSEGGQRRETRDRDRQTDRGGRGGVTASCLFTFFSFISD